MNWVDLLLLVIIALSIYNGILKGIILGLIELLSWMLGLILCFYLYPYVSKFFTNYLNSGISTLAISFLTTIVLIRLILYVVTGQLYKIAPVHYHHHKINRVLGALPGFLNGILYDLMLVTMLVLFPFSSIVKDASEKSFLTSKLTGVVEMLHEKITPFIEDVEKQTGPLLKIERGEQKFVTLGFKVKKFKRRHDLEDEMLDLINKERLKENLKPLKPDPEIAEVALSHSADMFRRGYFSHFTPEDKSPFDRMRSANVRFIAAGENLALAQTLTLAHSGLMKSPGHRANILHRDFGRVGIGILDGGLYGLMITQNFRN